jgi:hypothetical protein
LAIDLKVIAADSGAAILDKHYQPTHLVASVAVLVEPPYREPSGRIAEAIFREVDDSLEVIVREAELCLKMLSEFKADAVHLDMTLAGFLWRVFRLSSCLTCVPQNGTTKHPQDIASPKKGRF